MKTKHICSVNAPRQRRSRETQRRIVDAVSALVNKGGYQDATVQDIVRLARGSVGAFYGRFKDKDAALYVLYDQRCRRLEEMTEMSLRPKAGTGTLSDAIDAFIAVVLQQTMINAPVLRAGAALISSKASEPFWARAKAMNALFFQWMEDLLRERCAEHSHPNPHDAALYAVAVIGSLSRDAILFGTRLVAKKSGEDTFELELRRIVHGYLGVRPGGVA